MPHSTMSLILAGAKHQNICYVDEARDDTKILGQSDPENNGNEGLLHTPQSSSTKPYYLM